VAFYHHHPTMAVMLMVAAVIILHDFVVTWAIRKVFGKVYGFRLGKAILWVVSLVLVTASYFTVVAATAVIMKLRGKHLLPEGRRPAVPTYWTEREKVKPTLESLKRQF
jgi:hypothetical protein